MFLRLLKAFQYNKVPISLVKSKEKVYSFSRVFRETDSSTYHKVQFSKLKCIQLDQSQQKEQTLQ